MALAGPHQRPMLAPFTYTDTVEVGNKAHPAMAHCSGIHEDDVLKETEEVEEAIQRKTAAKRYENHFLRQKQINSYKSTMSREERDRRRRLRQGLDTQEESPKKKKKVNFDMLISSRAQGKSTERSPAKAKEQEKKRECGMAQDS